MTPRLPLHATLSLLGALVFALVVTSGGVVVVASRPRRDRPHRGADHQLPRRVGGVFALALYAARRRGRAWAIVGGLTAIHALLIANHLAG